MCKGKGFEVGNILTVAECAGEWLCVLVGGAHPTDSIQYNSSIWYAVIAIVSSGL